MLIQDLDEQKLVIRLPVMNTDIQHHSKSLKYFTTPEKNH